MESQQLINWTFGIIAAGLGWFARVLWEADRELRADLAKLREELPKEYVRRLDIESRFDKIDQSLERLYDKLDGKADK